jgi:hypothetical protein
MGLEATDPQRNAFVEAGVDDEHLDEEGVSGRRADRRR